MTGHRQLDHGREDTQTLQAHVIARWKDEDRLGQIHLARYLLHLFVRETFGFGKDRERIATKNTIRKDIQLQEIILPHVYIDSLNFLKD